MFDDDDDNDFRSHLPQIAFERKPKKCPVCGYAPVATIIYGMPAASDEFFDKVDRGVWSVGGCCRVVDQNGQVQPVWKCSKCETSFNKKRKIKK